MTQKELENKLGAMHLRFLDHEKNYAQLLKELNDYADLVEDYGSAVTSALAESLNNYERFMNLDNALSPRCIVIEKRKFEKGKRLSADNEGLYHVVLYLDDETRHDVKFSRKQEQLLYITTLLSSFKNGMCEEFFAGNPNPYMDVHCQLAKMIYPLLNEDKIDEDRRCAGYNMLVTSEIKADPKEIYAVYHNLWRIEESFRILKTYLEARPVFLHDKYAIKGHFLICYVALTLLRLLELKTFKDEIPAAQLVEFMRQYKITRNYDKSYINNATYSRTYEQIKEKLGLSKLGNVYLSQKDVDLLLKTEL